MRGMSYARSYVFRALTRSSPRTRARLQPLVGPGPVMVTGPPPASGLLLRDLDLGHAQGWGLVRGAVEPSVQEALRRHLGRGRVLWDVGANIGFFSLLGARLGAEVVAFEPVPENVARLRGNIASNGFDEVITVRDVAVAAATTVASLLVVEDASWSHLADRGWHPRTAGEIDVRVVALDDLALPAPDVIKIDVEGSEVAVLQGARRLLTERRPAVIIELHATNREVCELLDAAAYNVENLDGIESPVDAGPVHVLATPRQDRRPGGLAVVAARS